MRYELFIDKEKVDLSLSTNINLTYKSNLLSDISKIVSYYSYTIKLPATSKNKRIIKGANIVSANTQFPYIPHLATVVCDGVEIVSGANAILLSASQETIEIALSWGNILSFKDMLDFEGNIGDLGAEQSWLTWSPLMSEPSIIFPIVNYGDRQDIVHYAQPVSDLLTKITDKFGLTVTFDETKQDFIDKLVMPLTNTEVPYDDLESTSAILSSASWDPDKNVWFINLQRISPSITDCIASLEENVQGRYTNMACDVEINVEMYVSGILSGTLSDKVDIIVARQDPDGTLNELGRITSQTKVYIEGKGWLYRYKGTATIENFYGTIVMCLNVGFQVTISFYDDGVNPTVIFRPKPTSEYGEYPAFNRFYINTNLPKIKPVDLLKTVSSMTGCFAVPVNGTTIKMMSFSTLMANKANAIDWSRKVVTDYMGTMGTVGFQLSDYAQKNWLRYEEDDTVQGNYDAYISCDNKAIEQEKDMVTLEFAACDTKANIAYIPLYSTADDGGYEKNDVKDKILLFNPNDNTATFNGLSWSELLSANYGEFQEVVKKPKILSVQVRLSPVDLSVLDLTIPVYIQQVGAYFAIISVKTRQNNICDVELLKI